MSEPPDTQLPDVVVTGVYCGPSITIVPGMPPGPAIFSLPTVTVTYTKIAEPWRAFPTTMPNATWEAYVVGLMKAI